MCKYRIIMISNEHCIHCQNALRVIKLFVEKNSRTLEYTVIDAVTYRQNNQFGKFDEFPVFIFVGRTGNFRKFDFINNEKTERTYDKLKSVVSEMSRLH